MATREQGPLTSVAGVSTEPPPPLLSRVMARRSARDWLILDIVGAVLLVGPILVVDVVSPESGSGLDSRFTGTGVAVTRFAAICLVGVVLPWRRRQPVATLLLAATSASVALALDAGPALTVAVAVISYSVTVARNRRTSHIVFAVVAAMLIAGLGINSAGRVAGAVIPALAVLLAAWLAGENTRSRRAYAAAVAQRAAEKEVERDERLRRAVADERLVIARELHDVVAHSMSVIAVRAGVARMVVDSQPDEARDALAIIETTTRTALHEMRLLVGVLRRSDGSTTEFNPAPGLAALDALVVHVGQAGVTVSVQIEGQPRALPAGVDLSAYRIIQEALTNVVRHAGPTRAALRLGYHADDLTIDLIDEGSRRYDRASPGSGGGHGLIGMRERASLYGGVLTAGPDGHGFGVHVRLPTTSPAR